MNVFLAADSSTQNNWGCRATTEALAQQIEAAGASINGRFTLNRMNRPLQGDERGRSHGQLGLRAILANTPAIEDLARRTKWMVEQLRGPKAGILRSYSDFEPFATVLNQGEVLKSEREGMEAADIVLINGEGGIYGRQRKGLMMLFLAWYAKKHLGKTVAIVNHTAELIPGPLQDAAAHVYPLFDDVIFREPASAAAVAPLAPQIADPVGADSAFTLLPAPRDRWLASAGERRDYFSFWPFDAATVDLSRPYVCVGGSSSYNHPDIPSSDPIAAYEAICAGIAERGLQPVLFASDETDFTLLKPLALKMRLVLMPPSMPVPQAHDVLANAACLISGRWHPSILALTGGTPTIMLTANSYKSRGLLELVGLDAPVFETSSLATHVPAILNLLDRYVGEAATLRTHLIGRVSEAAALAGKNVRILS